jgi:hypothetical protein
MLELITVITPGIPSKSPSANKPVKRSFFAAALSLSVGLAGCRRSGPPVGTATNVQSAFKATRTDIREFADQGVEAEGKGDFNTAFVHYRALSLNPELTQQQRDAANESMLQMGAKLRESAKNGDKDAEKVLDNYRATK